MRQLLSLKEEFEKIDPSLCTESQIRDALDKVDIGIRQMMEDLATLVQHNYHNRKWHDFAFIEETIGLYGDALAGIKLCLVRFAGMVYWCHDIGRLFEGCCVMTKNNAIAVPVTYENHGLAAVHIVLRRLAVEMVISDLARAAFDYAIAHHHDRFLPEIGDDADYRLRVMDFFARFLRDVDMLGGLLRKTDGWLYDAGRKRDEREQYGIEGECGAIIPVTALDDFAKYLPVDIESIKKGGSWEGYQLSHLAWIFNISFRDTLDILVRGRVVEKYLAYFAKQLGETSEEYCPIRDTVRRYLDEQGVGHEF